MRLRVLGIAALPLLFAGCTGTKTTSQSVLSNAMASRDVKTVDAELAPIVAGKNSLVYHSRYCQYAAAIENKIGFASAHDAEMKHLIPCEFCNPHLLPVARNSDGKNGPQAPVKAGSEEKNTAREKKPELLEQSASRK
jgi:hypothetical protein